LAKLFDLWLLFGPRALCRVMRKQPAPGGAVVVLLVGLGSRQTHLSTRVGVCVVG
jgi:hypothetical protein